MAGINLNFGNLQWTLPGSLTKGIKQISQAQTGSQLAPSVLVKKSLANPIDYPMLSQALTPDDTVAIAIDDSINQFPALLLESLKEIHLAGVPYEKIHLVHARESEPARWMNSLPKEMNSLQIEQHNPAIKEKLGYLAASQNGDPVFLNRTLVETDQVVVIGNRRLHPLLGRAGAETELFPLLSDLDSLSLLEKDPDGKAIYLDSNPIRARALEASWLLGAPYFIQAIEGHGPNLLHVLAGAKEAIFQADNLLDRTWLKEISSPVDLVVACLGDCPGKDLFQEISLAVAFSRGILKPGGSIALLCEQQVDIQPIKKYLETKVTKDKTKPGPGQDFFKGSAIRKWVEAATEFKVHLYCGNSPAQAAQLLAHPLTGVKDLISLVEKASSVLVIPEASKTFVRLTKKT
ncbi:MAG: DUF2088 domain-containing protein [Gemmataceae bacterium]|nr:DUF2088 domain-containing protein [Gemmataceae bacterium]